MRSLRVVRVIGAVWMCTLVGLLLPWGSGYALPGAQVVDLQNPGFDLPYIEQGAGEVQIAEGWQAWWLDALTEIPGIEGGSSGGIPTSRPEYKPALASLDPYRPRGGEGTAQQWFNFSRPGYAGVLQQVEVDPGQAYQFSIWAHCWCSNDNDDPYFCPADRMYVSLGIDPTGGTWPKSRAIQWSQWQTAREVYAQFSSPEVRAEGSRITVWVAVAFKWALRHNNAYIDDAQLARVPTGGTPCPTPVPCPTGTPCPICTPQAGTVDYDRIKADVLDALAEWDRR